MAIKCPNIDGHLATFKKFQEAFSDNKLVTEIMSEKHQESIDKLGNIFEGMWSLEHIMNPEAKEVHEVVQKAIEKPGDYILKPQREGGGNNLYDDELKKVLTTWDKKDIAQFLIMEKIRAPKIKHYMLRAGRA